MRKASQTMGLDQVAREARALERELLASPLSASARRMERHLDRILALLPQLPCARLDALERRVGALERREP